MRKRFDVRSATDEQLVVRFEACRDDQSFAELVRRHGPMVLETAKRILKSQEDAEDAVQATFLAFARKADRLRNKSPIAGWLYVPAGHCAHSIQRTNLRGKEKIRRAGLRGNVVNKVDQNNPAIAAMTNEDAIVLDEEVRKLPEKVRAAIVLCHLEGISQRQSAAQLGVPPATLGERLSKGHRILRRRLMRRHVGVPLAGMIAAMTKSDPASGGLSASFTADITAKAIQFAAGMSAAELGVSSTVAQAIHAALSAATSMKVTIGLIAVAGILSCGTLAAVAAMQQPAVSQVTVGTNVNQNVINGQSISWNPVPLHDIGNVISDNGSLNMEQNARTAFIETADTPWMTNVSIRAHFRETQGGAPIGLLARWDLFSTVLTCRTRWSSRTSASHSRRLRID